MRKFFVILAAALLLASCGSPLLNTPATGPADNAGLPVMPVTLSTTDAELQANPSVSYGYIIAKVTDDFNVASFVRSGANVVGTMTVNGNRYYRLHADAKYSKVINSLRVLRGVLYADPELLSKRIMPVSNDAASRGLLEGNLAADPVSEWGDYALEITGALAAYDDATLGYGTNPVYVAVIDTGINMTHEDFWYDDDANPATPEVSMVEYAKSAFNKAADGTMTWIGDLTPFVTIPAGANWDDEGHGTHVTGTIAARGNNGVGVAGVAWKNTKIISYKCFANAASGSGADWSIYGALGDLTDWVLDQRTNHGLTQGTIPVNMSLGGDYAGNFEYEMLNYALSEGVLPVVAMGNDGKYQGQFPASYQGVLAVGATNGKDEKVHFSNSGHWISVSAPGFDILSTGNGGSMWQNPTYSTGDYQWMSGTSMATPFVTGMIGYLLSFRPLMTPYQVKALLEQTATDKGTAGFDPDFGWGRVNVFTAANTLVNGTGIPVAGAAYCNSKIVVTVANTAASYVSPIVGTDWVVGQPVYLYNATGTFRSVGLTNGTNGQVEFRGLPAGNYTVKTNFFDDTGSNAVTLANAADQTVAFSFNKAIVYICTVPNLAYNAGADGTDTIITVYSDQALTTAVAGPYDQNTLDTLMAALDPGTYYAVIESYNGYAATALNYGISIGYTSIVDCNVTDGVRAATAADSHEQDDDGTQALAKGALALDTPFAANLGGDLDVFMFVVP